MRLRYWSKNGIRYARVDGSGEIPHDAGELLGGLAAGHQAIAAGAVFVVDAYISDDELATVAREVQNILTRPTQSRRERKARKQEAIEVATTDITASHDSHPGDDIQSGE